MDPIDFGGQCCPFTGISVAFTTFLIVLGVVWYLKKVVLVFIIGLIVLGWVHYTCDCSGRRTAIANRTPTTLPTPTHAATRATPMTTSTDDHGLASRAAHSGAVLVAWVRTVWPVAASPCPWGSVGGSG